MVRRAIGKLIITTLAVCGSISGHTWAQHTRASDPIILGETDGVDGTDCETTKALLDLVAINSGTDRTIIIIATHGRREPSRRINGRRLAQLRSFLEMTRGISKQRIITAVGERAGDAGRVEMYVGGELKVIFKMKRNKDFFVSCYG
jgi:hypothetical protein